MIGHQTIRPTLSVRRLAAISNIVEIRLVITTIKEHAQPIRLRFQRVKVPPWELSVHPGSYNRPMGGRPNMGKLGSKSHIVTVFSNPKNLH
jgi:hypothetical protein